MLAALLEAAPALDAFECAALGEEARLAEHLSSDENAVTAVAADGFTALHLASFFGRPGAVRLLLERGADANALAGNGSGLRPLHSAVAARSEELVDLLLAAGADPDARQAGGFTALHAAAKHGDLGIAERLIAAGADAALRTEEGQTALDLAAPDVDELRRVVGEG